MDALLSAALLFALAAPVGLAAAWLVFKGPSARAGSFGPQPGLGWPRRVQEEEPVVWIWNDRHAGGPPPSGSEAAGSPTVERVVFQLGRGSARSRIRGERRGQSAR